MRPLQRWPAWPAAMSSSGAAGRGEAAPAILGADELGRSSAPMADQECAAQPVRSGQPAAAPSGRCRGRTVVGDFIRLWRQAWGLVQQTADGPELCCRQQLEPDQRKHLNQLSNDCAAAQPQGRCKQKGSEGWPATVQAKAPPTGSQADWWSQGSVHGCAASASPAGPCPRTGFSPPDGCWSGCRG